MAGAFDNLLDLLRGNSILPAPAVGETRIPSTDNEWLELLHEAHRQRVMGLVADAVAALPEERKPSFRIRARLAMETETIERMNRAVNNAAAKLSTIYKSAGLHPVIQKGPAVAALYPNPLHRECGDIDIFFSQSPEGPSTAATDEFSRSREIALKLCSATATGPGGVQGEVATEQGGIQGAAATEPNGAWGGLTDEADGAFHYRYGGVLVEHHPRFYDSACQFPQFDVQSPEAQIIMLSTHILKHALGKGIGLKQICDYFVARERLDYDKAKVAEAIGAAGLAKWQTLLDGFGPDLRRIVERSGNFGRGEDTRTAGNQSKAPDIRITASPQKAPCTNSRLATALSFLRSIPFALKYAPREWLHTVTTLAFH